MSEPQPDVVHQAFFAFQPEHGYTLAASSLPTSEERERWLRSLRRHLRLLASESESPPERATSYVEFSDGTVVVLHRWTQGDSPGRNPAHALIGTATTLSVSIAVGLAVGLDWLKTVSQPLLSPLPAADLVKHAHSASTQLRARSRAQPVPLARILAQLIDNPLARMSIIGCPNEYRIPLMWGLHEIGSQYLEAVWGIKRSWSFSTYETEEVNNVLNWPAFVFMPARPRSTPPDRQIVDLSRDGSVSQSAIDVSNKLISRYLAGEHLMLGFDVTEPASAVPSTPSTPKRPKHAAPARPVPRAAAPTPARPGSPGSGAGSKGAGTRGDSTRGDSTRGDSTRGDSIMVRCPTCMDSFLWSADNEVRRFDEYTSEFVPMDIGQLDGVKRADALRNGYVRCPNPSQDAQEHYLPASYASHKNPLVIGLVGASRSGKTHLLAALIREAHAGGLAPFGLTVAAFDFRRHQQFRRSHLEPLDDGLALAATDTNVLEYADTLLLRRHDGAVWPVTFFDVSGEDLQSAGSQDRGGRFLIGANALIFTHAVEDSFEIAERSGSGRAGSVRNTNQALSMALERVRAVRDATEVAGIPVAIAVTKADRLRYVPPADRWLRRGAERVADPAMMHAESRDVYAYLHHNDAGASLDPFTVFRRCTLHFVSASGGDASWEKKQYARGVRPIRVLQPLVAILAMTGIITGPDAERVGT